MTAAEARRITDYVNNAALQAEKTQIHLAIIPDVMREINQLALQGKSSIQLDVNKISCAGRRYLIDQFKALGYNAASSEHVSWEIAIWW